MTDPTPPAPPSQMENFSLIKSLQADIAALRQERDRLESNLHDASIEIADREARIAELEGALRGVMAIPPAPDAVNIANAALGDEP